MHCMLKPLSRGECLQIWGESAKDVHWPFPHRNKDAFEQWFDEQSAIRALHLGEVFCVTIDERPAGFAVMHRIAEEWLPAGVSAVECGTYLLPSERGRSINPFVKHWLFKYAFDSFQVDWCLFVIPVDNIRAQFAIRKLPWPWHFESLESPGTFRKFLKRKSWENRQAAVLYAFSRTDFPSPTNHKPLSQKSHLTR